MRERPLCVDVDPAPVPVRPGHLQSFVRELLIEQPLRERGHDRRAAHLGGQQAAGGEGEVADDFGLDGIKRVDLKWGYQGEALVSVSRILAPSPRKGVLALFDQPTFDAKSLPPLPDGVGTFTAFSIDLVKVFDQLSALARAADPKGPDLFAQDRLVVIEEPFLLVDGVLQHQDGVISVRAESMQGLEGPALDFDAHDFY